MLLDDINADRLAAMKETDPSKKEQAKQTRLVLTTLKGSIDQVNSKGATDKEVKAVIKSALKGIAEMKAILVKAKRSTEKEDFEISVLSKYMPSQFDEARTTEIIQEIVDKVGFTGMKDIGKVMGALSKYGDLLDRGLANKILRGRL